VHEDAAFCAAPDQGVAYVFTMSGAWCCRNGSVWQLITEQPPPHRLNATSLALPLVSLEPRVLLMSYHDGGWSAHVLHNQAWMPFRISSTGAATEVCSASVPWMPCKKPDLNSFSRVLRALAAREAVYFLADGVGRCRALYRICIGEQQHWEKWNGEEFAKPGWYLRWDLISFQREIFVLEVKGTICQHRRPQNPSSDYSKVTLSLRSLSVPEGSHKHVLGTVQTQLPAPFQAPSISVIVGSLETGIYVFLLFRPHPWGHQSADRVGHGSAAIAADRGMFGREDQVNEFDAGWVYTGTGEVRALCKESLQFPCGGLFAALCEGKPRVIGGGRALLIVTASECAEFNAQSERWRDAPLPPAAIEFGPQHQFIGADIVYMTSASFDMPPVSFVDEESMLDFYDESPQDSGWLQLPDCKKRDRLEGELEVYFNKRQNVS